IRPDLNTSPVTLISDVRCSTSDTIAWGSMARSLRASTMACWSSTWVRPLARIAPPYGIEMLPLTSTAWVGMLIKLPGRTLASAGMKSPPELASKIVTPTRSPIPKRRSLGRLRSGNSPTSLGAALAKISATLGVIRTKAYGIFLGSCCPAHTSQLAGPVAGIKAQPPTARCDIRSAKLNRIPRPRTVALPPTEPWHLCKQLCPIHEALIWNPLEMACFIRVLLARHTDGPGDDGRATPPMIENTPIKRLRPTPPPAGKRANHVKLVLAGMMAVGTLMSTGSV